jgi:hypothetical protein
LHFSTIPLGSPKRSLPKMSAAFNSAPAAACSANWRGASTGGEYSRRRADTAAAKLMPSSASAMLPTMRAEARMSCAPLANATASSCSSMPSKRGVTSTSSPKPMVFIARATEPILPGRLVSTRIIRRR